MRWRSQERILTSQTRYLTVTRNMTSYDVKAERVNVLIGPSRNTVSYHVGLTLMRVPYYTARYSGRGQTQSAD
jgi:hypothetical protein